VPTKNITSDTTKAIYLNASQLEIDLSLRKQNYHKGVGFLPLFAVGFLLLDVFTHSRTSTVATIFLNIMEPGTQHFLLSAPAFILFILPGYDPLV